MDISTSTLFLVLVAKYIWCIHIFVHYADGLQEFSTRISSSQSQVTDVYLNISITANDTVQATASMSTQYVSYPTAHLYFYFSSGVCRNAKLEYWSLAATNFDGNNEDATLFINDEYYATCDPGSRCCTCKWTENNDNKCTLPATVANILPDPIVAPQTIKFTIDASKIAYNYMQCHYRALNTAIRISCEGNPAEEISSAPSSQPTLNPNVPTLYPTISVLNQCTQMCHNFYGPNACANAANAANSNGDAMRHEEDTENDKDHQQVGEAVVGTQAWIYVLIGVSIGVGVCTFLLMMLFVAKKSHNKKLRQGDQYETVDKSEQLDTDTLEMETM